MTKLIPLDTELKTKRLILRAIKHSDIGLVWSASRFDGFNDGMVWDPPNNEEELEIITDKNISDWKKGIHYNFTIDLSNNNEPIGRITIRQTDTRSIWNIGFWIHPEHQDNGYATEAARAIIDFGFSTLEAIKITSAHAKWNTPSKRVLEKLGFKFTRENPSGFIKSGKPVVEYEYEIENNIKRVSID